LEVAVLIVWSPERFTMPRGGSVDPRGHAVSLQAAFVFTEPQMTTNDTIRIQDRDVPKARIDRGCCGALAKLSAVAML
jgi:hypothetical protein